MLSARQLDRMRATSTRAMPDQGSVTRPGVGAQTWDPSTGTHTGPPPQTIYTGVCRVRKAGAVEQDVEVGELHETLGRYVGTFPWNSGGIEVDDFLVLTVSTDPQLIGRPLRVVDLSVGSNHIDRRVILEDEQQT
jgi:hypothetical protein